MRKQGSCVQIDRAVVANHRWQQWIIGNAAVIEMAYRRRVRSMIHQLTTAAGVNWVIHAVMVLGNAVDWLTHSVSPSSSRTCSLTASVLPYVFPVIISAFCHFSISSYPKSSCRGLGALGLVYFELNSLDIKGTRFGCIFSYSTMTVLLFRSLIWWRKSLLNF